MDNEVYTTRSYALFILMTGYPDNREKGHNEKVDISIVTWNGKVIHVFKKEREKYEKNKQADKA